MSLRDSIVKVAQDKLAAENEVQVQEPVEVTAPAEPEVSAGEPTGDTSEVNVADAVIELDKWEDPRKVKLRTVDGEEVLPVQELGKGYMRNKRFTQAMQQLREQERNVKSMLDDPERLLNYARERGYLKDEPVKEVQEESEPEFETESEKILWKKLQESNKALNEVKQQVQGLTPVVTEFQNSVAQSQSQAMARQFKQEFDAKRSYYKVPDNALPIIVALQAQGNRVFGPTYTIDAALNDFNKLVVKGFDPIDSLKQDKTKFEGFRKQIIDEYLAEKEKDRKATVSVGQSPGTVTTGEPKKRMTWEAVREKLKEFGGT